MIQLVWVKNSKYINCVQNMNSEFQNLKYQNYEAQYGDYYLVKFVLDCISILHDSVNGKYYVNSQTIDVLTC